MPTWHLQRLPATTHQDAALLVVAELIEHGELMPVTLGLDFQSLDPALREVMELPNGVQGVLVNRCDIFVLF